MHIFDPMQEINMTLSDVHCQQEWMHEISSIRAI